MVLEKILPSSLTKWRAVLRMPPWAQSREGLWLDHALMIVLARDGGVLHFFEDRTYTIEDNALRADFSRSRPKEGISVHLLLFATNAEHNLGPSRKAKIYVECATDVMPVVETRIQTLFRPSSIKKIDTKLFVEPSIERPSIEFLIDFAISLNSSI